MKMLKLKNGPEVRATFVTSWLIIISLVFPGVVASGTTAGNLPVSVNVIVWCNVTINPVNFGSVTGLTTINSTGNIIVNCPTGQLYNITLDGGLHYAGGYRHIASGSYEASYELQKPDLMAWGDSDYANTYSGGSSLQDTGNDTDQSHTVNATLSPFTGIPVDTILTDTVTVTVYY